MAVIDVVEWPAKVLETRAKEVENFDADLKSFVKDMHETMDHAGGIGLAANQVGDLRRVIAILIPWADPEEGEEPFEAKKEWHDKRFTFINPVITAKNGKTKYMEGCLSFPEMFDFVNRAEEITVKYFDENGKEQELTCDGLMSICLQHEIDHIDGIVFINRMSRLKSGRIKKQMMIRAQARSIESE
jgi:peptide deformylase